jgi:hypothetical protein
LTQITGLSAQYFGDTGGATSTSYYVQAIFPDGSLSPIAGPATVTTPAALSSGNIVGFSWNPVPGAVAYNVFKNTTGTTPTGAGAFGLAMATTTPNFTDRGQTALTVTIPAPSGIQMTNTTAADTATLSLAQTINAVLTATPTAAAALTTPTAAAILLAIAGAPLNQVAATLIIRNTSAGANTITFTAGSGVTITGTATIAQNKEATFLIIPTSATAVTFLSVASGGAF